jgi:hypothetical protein
MSSSTIKHQRQAAAYQFELEAVRLGFSVLRPLTNFRYVVQESRTGTQYTAMVLPTSFDFYEYRLNSGKRRVDLLIVQRHNAVVPLRVLSLSQVTSYAPLDVPPIERTERQRRNHEESRLLVSKLLLNFESAWDELSRMSVRTQHRYLRLREQYLKPRIGRPWAS